jgi:hypothetical protein
MPKPEIIAQSVCVMLFGWFMFTYILPIQITDGETFHGACPSVQKVQDK